MLITERILLSISIAWTILALIYQWISARGPGRIDYSEKSGDPIKGIIYNFTWAMLPSHKETIRLHPGPFTVGVLMHIGIFYAIIRTLILLIDPGIVPTHPNLLGIIPAIGAFSALFLFIKRFVTPEMKAMSSLDDYLSVLLTCDFAAAAATLEFGHLTAGAFLIHAIILFLYFPLGKLKHALFFFIARADYGSRLGYRGVYPVKSGVNK